jgi:hypothetical protein
MKFTESVTCKANHRVEVERHTVTGHQIVEVDAVLLRHHRHVDRLRGHRHPRLSRLDRRGVHAAVSEEPGLLYEHRFVTRVGCDRHDILTASAATRHIPASLICCCPSSYQDIREARSAGSALWVREAAHKM